MASFVAMPEPGRIAQARVHITDINTKVGTTSLEVGLPLHSLYL